MELKSGDTARFCSEEANKWTDVSAACNPHRHIRHRKSTTERVHRVSPDLVQYTKYCHRATMCKVRVKHTPVKQLAPLTTRSSSQRWAAEHQTAEQYSKTGKTKHIKHVPRSNLSWNTCQDFLKIPSHWEAALETGWRCFSKVILESNVPPNITRSSDSFSTVLPIVNAGDWECIVRDLETIIVLALVAFNFIPQRSHHSLTFMRSRLRDSATATLRPGDGTTAIKVESSA